MVKVTTLYLMQLCLFYGTNHEQARLPKWVFRVDSCPLPNNISKWQDASRRLHCLHDLNATDMGNTYHCLPSGYLNESVEFCGKGIFIPPGHCPFYDYKVNADDIPDLYNCSAFISGCPTKTFASKDVRKFFSCLNINSIYRCYEEESNCPKTSATLVPTKITNDIKTATNSELYVSVIICVVILIGLIALMVLMYKRKFPCQQTDLILKIKKDTPTIANGENTHNVQIEDTGFVPPDTQKVSEAECETLLKKGTVIANTIPPELNEFNDFLEKIRGRITYDIWHAMKCCLCDFMDHERVKKMNPSEILNVLSDMFKPQYNMGFLEWMFDKCGEPKLVKECQDFSSKNPFQLECFSTSFTPCGESRKLEFQFMVFEIESYLDELQDLRQWLAKTIHVHPGQILMTALKNGPIVATFLMREKHGSAILEYLKTDDGRIAASRKRIERIVENGNVIEIGKALNGSNYVQFRLRFREKSSGIQSVVSTVASIFLRRTGIRMEGDEIYIRTVPSDGKRNEAESKLIKEESFIEKNHSLILENIEPLTIGSTDIASLFDREDLARMNDIEGRRARAEYFLKLCDMLPKEKKERACECLERILSLPKEKLTHDELSPIKKWIQQNREDLLDEIDSEFIKSTIYLLDGVPEEVKTSWSDPSKSRKEKATIFLDFALQKDKYVKALKKSMEENGMQFTE